MVSEETDCLGPERAESWGHTKHQASPSLQELRVTFVPDNYKCALGTRQAASELYPDTRRTKRYVFPCGDG